MTTNTITHVVATTFRGVQTQEWTLSSGHTTRAGAREEVRQLRHYWATKGRRGRVFTTEEWDSLPTGTREDDWIILGDGTRAPRGRRL